MRKETALFLIVTLHLAGPSGAQNRTAQDRLSKLFDERLAWQMEEFPRMAMSRGDYTNADRITDNSLAAIERRQRETQRYRNQLFLVNYDELSKGDRLSYDLFELQLSNAIEGFDFRMFLAPIGSRYGPHQDIPQMGERLRFQSYQDYENYLTRLSQVPRMVSQAIERLRLGVAEGRTPARITLAGLPAQLDSIIGGGLGELARPLDRMPDSFTPAQRETLRTQFDDEVMPAVRGAVRVLRDYVVDEYIGSCRESIAASDLPDGEAYYAFRLRVMTTTEMTADEIHQLGLDEVARIRREMMDVIRSSDFMSMYSSDAGDDDRLFAAFLQYLRSDPRFYHTTAEELLAGYRDICKQVDAWLPKLFVTLPRLPYGVRAIPDFMAPTQTTAYYGRGDIRNAEPGYFYANTYALDQRPKYEMIPLALHEAVPGHHLQIALAQELDDLPEVRKDSYFNAFGEGWALYAERLGLEMGLYEDPYDNFGRLLYEMWRACRLAVDTGLHAKGWSRDRAIEYMGANTALSRLNIENEVDRYINWPGQACGYKIGELTIRRLRERAERSLRDRFDLREFHDAVLGAGSIPLTILEKRINYWVNSQLIRTYD